MGGLSGGGAKTNMAIVSLLIATAHETTWYHLSGDQSPRARIHMHRNNPAAAASSCNFRDEKTKMHLMVFDK